MPGTRVTTALAALLFSIGGAWADDVFVSGRLQRISTSSGVGGGGGIDWNHAASPRQALRLGFSIDALPGTRWGLGRGGATRSFGRTSVAADLMAGHSSVEGGFFQLRGGVTHPLWGQRVLGDVEGQYVGGRTAKGTLAKAGLTFLPRPSLIFQGGYFHSFGGTLGSRLAVAKAVYLAGPRRYLAGASVGRSSPSVLGLVDQRRPQAVRHAFVGAAFPIAVATELTIVLEHYDLEVANRSLLTLIWKVGRREKGR